MPKSLKIYLTLVISIGAIIALYSIFAIPLILNLNNIIFMTFFVLCDYFEFYAFQSNAKGGYAFSIGAINCMFITIFFGPTAAILASAISVIIVSINRYKRKITPKPISIKTFFNMAQFIICIFTAYLGMSLLGIDLSTTADLLKFIGIIIVYNLTNNLLVSAVISFSTGKLYLDNLNLKKNALYYLYVLVLTILLSYMFFDRGLIGVLLIYSIALQLQKVTQLYFNNVVQREQLEEKNKELITDTLTKIYNYKYLEQVLNERIENKQRFSLIFIDLDKFKYINDTYGHAAGNVALQSLTGFIKAKLEPEDVFCRYGGDEFCIVINNKQNAINTANKILTDNNSNYVEYGDHKFQVHLSVGIYDYEIKENNVLDIINQADEAMYEAKKQGGNRVIKCN
jgi:diguanylate cyclase (GGDEF)-like protein